MSILVSAYLLSTQASAAAPPPAWVEPRGAPAVHTGQQRRMAAQPGWRAFAAAEGAGWEARFDEASGVAERAWGPPIALGSPRTAAAVESGLRALFGRYPGLTGVPAADLPLRSARYDARHDTWYVDFDRTESGVPIWRAGVTARVVGGALVMLGVSTFPDAALPGVAAPGDVLLPISAGRALSYSLVQPRFTTTTNPPGRWTELVQRRTGAVLAATNAVRFLDGTMTGVHDVRTIDSGTAIAPMPYVPLTGSGGSTSMTGADGAFSVNDSETWTASLRGDLVDVTNEAGAEGTLSLAAGATEWTEPSATQAEIDAYVFQYRVREFGLRFAPDLDFLTTGLRTKVNVSVTCYSFFDGAVNFGIEGDGCNNPARIADANYHEWGHAFHEYSVLSGVVDGTVGEGVGDLVAALMTLDPEIGPGFYDDGRALRELSTDIVYPDDMRNNIYRDSLIFSGAVWDWFELLQARYGEGPSEQGEAWEVVATRLTRAIQGGPTLTQVYDEFVFADDDDGDLSNGTPHLCELVEAFGPHGLGPLHEAFPAFIEHTAVENQPLGVDVPITGRARSLAPGCLDAGVVTVEVTWSTDGGATWQRAPLTLTGDQFSGVIPAFEAATTVQYAIVAAAADGTKLWFPEQTWAPFGFYAGELWPVWCEDFSAGEGGFTHGLLEGVGAAADDWQFGVPYGESGDPSAAWSGESVWGNDLGEGANNGNYPYEVRNRLYSPAVDVSGLEDVVVQYRRYLSVDDGIYDVATLYANESVLWQTGAGDGTQQTLDPAWVQHTLALELDAEVATDDSLTISWEIASDGTTSLGGWTVDDVCVYRTTAPTVDTGDTADTGPVDTGGREDTGEPADSADGAGEPDEPDCGCRSSGAPAGALAPAVVALAALRRRYGQSGAPQ
ncbi:hypothetical protein LBMAG42_31910 [Deltaproteobacteria bacterium]|nr:hypothetical protein LBMAG42_31910 [Deltaproteobacteria bacterium]